MPGRGRRGREDSFPEQSGRQELFEACSTLAEFPQIGFRGFEITAA